MALSARALLEDARNRITNTTAKREIGEAIALIWPPTPPTPPPAPPATLVGLDIYQLAPTTVKFGITAGPDISGCVHTVRMAGTSQGSYNTALLNPELEAWKALGLNVIIMDGSNNPKGIVAETPAQWGSRCVERGKAHPAAIEIGNEIYGDWFWGPNALTEAAANAYIAILAACREAMDRAYGRGNYAPLLASVQGGEKVKWTEMLAAKGLSQYVDGVAVHCYPQKGQTHAEAMLAHRDRAEQCHTITGLPVWITEVGYTTKVEPAPYPYFTPQEEAEDLVGFVNWGKSQSYVKAVTVYAYEERGEGFGVVDEHWLHKPAYAALQGVAR